MKAMFLTCAAVLCLSACGGMDESDLATGEMESGLRRARCPSRKDVSYVSRDPAECAAILFTCAAGAEYYFSDTCGCGCKKVTAPCVVGGCSGQLCYEDTGDPIFTTCEYRSDYACYQTATCERQSNGQCGWTQTAELTACLSAASP